MTRVAARLAVVSSLFVSVAAVQTNSAVSASAVWNTLSTPAMDPAKFAHTENASIVRDRVRITLIDGTIQFAQPVNGVVFGAVFHGSGRLQADPPNPIEAQQLRLFTKQEKLDMNFSEATFSFTDGLIEEVAKQAKWKHGGPASDELYAKRQQEREDLGSEYLPRLFQSVLSGDLKRTAYFLADLKTKEKGWVEVRDDATQFEEIRVGRWVDLGGVKEQDYWMHFPADGRDPRHAYDDPAARQDFLIPSYQINADVAENAELNVTTKAIVQTRYSGERVLLFSLDPNLRVSSVKDAQGRDLEFYQAREQKDRLQSFGEYVAVVLKDPTQAGQSQVLEFKSGGKRVVFKVGDGNYFCKSFGWYPSAFSNEPGVETFAFRSNLDMTFESPKRFSLVAIGNKASETTDGKKLITNWKSDLPLAAAGFVFGDYKITKEKVGDVEIQIYANNQPDDLLKSIQAAFDNPMSDLEGGPNASSRSGGRQWPRSEISLRLHSAKLSALKLETPCAFFRIISGRIHTNNSSLPTSLAVTGRAGRICSISAGSRFSIPRSAMRSASGIKCS
jgi:hypothetical protein